MAKKEETIMEFANGGKIVRITGDLHTSATMAEREESFKAYITKYALTKGILEMFGYVSLGSQGMLVTKSGYFHVEGRDWHRTEESAKRKAEDMRVRKIAAMNKSIKKLEKLKF